MRQTMWRIAEVLPISQIVIVKRAIQGAIQKFPNDSVMLGEYC